MGLCAPNWSTEAAPGQEAAGFSRKSQRVRSPRAAEHNMQMSRCGWIPGKLFMGTNIWILCPFFSNVTKYYSFDTFFFSFQKYKNHS